MQTLQGFGAQALHDVQAETWNLWCDKCRVHHFERNEDILKKVRTNSIGFGGLLVAPHQALETETHPKPLMSESSL